MKGRDRVKTASNCNLDPFFKAGVYQKLLLKKLFENYNPFERPAEFENQTLDVKLGMALQQIVDVVSCRVPSV